MTTLIATFIILNIVNVILQTIKSLATVKCGKAVAATVNAIAYGLYTVVIVYMVCDLPLVLKVVVVGACNFVGVYVVKFVEEKMRKDKLWKVEATVRCNREARFAQELTTLNIPFNYTRECVGKYSIFNIYCATQKESTLVKQIADRHKARYFVSESKTL